MGRQQQLPQYEEPSWILCGTEGGNLAPSKNDIPMSAYKHPGALPQQLPRWKASSLCLIGFPGWTILIVGKFPARPKWMRLFGYDAIRCRTDHVQKKVSRSPS